MRNILIINFLIYYSLLFSQNSNFSKDDVGKIAISVIIPDNISGLDSKNLSKLESKITQITTINGLAASGYNNSFLIYPKYEVFENGKAEGGMEIIYTIKSELSLYIKQNGNNLVFSSVTIPVKGYGKSIQQAISNSISSIQVKDSRFTEFISTAKDKIIKYYESKCGDIMLKSESLSKMQKYDEALGLLMTVPEECSSCYNKVQEKTIQAFVAYQNQRCAENMQQAKASLAGKDFGTSLQILGSIDPSSKCFEESQNLMKANEDKIDANLKQQWDFEMEKYHDQVSMEKYRIDAMKEIATEYYKSQKPANTTINYNIIK